LRIELTGCFEKFYLLRDGLILGEMMAVFVFTIRGDLSRKLERIRSLAAQKGVTFRGGLGSGTFKGGISFLGMAIRGSYSIVGDKITVDVMEKPTSYTWDRVESELRGFVEG
jgi:hypothetical protein